MQWRLFLVSPLPAIANTLISPILPQLFMQFSDTKDAAYFVRFLVTTPALLTLLGLPIAHFLVQRWQPRTILLGSLLLYGLAGSSGLVLAQLEYMLVGRAFLGLAIAGILASLPLLLHQSDSLGRRQMAWTGISSFFVLLLSGAIAQWRTVFALYLTGLILFGVVRAGQGSLGQGSLGKNSSVMDSLVQSEPMTIPCKLPFRQRFRWGSFFSLVLIHGIAFTLPLIATFIPIQLPFYLDSLMPGQPIFTGIAIALWLLMGAIASLSYRRLSLEQHPVNLLLLTLGLMGVGSGMIGVSPYYSLVLLGVSLVGFGIGICLPNLTHWVEQLAWGRSRRWMLGSLMTAMLLGQFIAPVVNQVLLESGQASVYSFSGGLLLIAVLIFMALKRPLVRAIKVSNYLRAIAS
jgi:MFS family permease